MKNKRFLKYFKDSLLIMLSALFVIGSFGGAKAQEKFLRIEPGELVINLGENAKLNAIATDENGNKVSQPDIEWSVEGDAVSIEKTSGTQIMVNAKDYGFSTITARWGNTTATSRVMVYMAQEIQLEKNLKLTPSGEVTIKVGQKLDISCKISDENGKDVPYARVQWSSACSGTTKETGANRLGFSSDKPTVCQIRASYMGLEATLTIKVVEMCLKVTPNPVILGWLESYGKSEITLANCSPLPLAVNLSEQAAWASLSETKFTIPANGTKKIYVSSTKPTPAPGGVYNFDVTAAWENKKSPVAVIGYTRPLEQAKPKQTFTQGWINNGSNHNRSYAVPEGNGTETNALSVQWAQNLGLSGNMMMLDKKLYLVSANYDFVGVNCYNLETGGRIWTSTNVRDKLGFPLDPKTNAMIAEGKEFFCIGGSLFAVSLADGKLLWSWQPNGSEWVGLFMTYANGLVWTGGSSLHCFDPKTGLKLGSYGENTTMYPAYMDGKIYFVSVSSSLFGTEYSLEMLDPATEKITTKYRWDENATGASGGKIDGIYCSEGYICIATYKNIKIFNTKSKNGFDPTILYDFTTSLEDRINVSIIGGKAYFHDDNELYCFDLSSATYLWRVKSSDPFVGLFSISGSRIFISTRRTGLKIYDTRNGKLLSKPIDYTNLGYLDGQWQTAVSIYGKVISLFHKNGAAKNEHLFVCLDDVKDVPRIPKVLSMSLGQNTIYSQEEKKPATTIRTDSPVQSIGGTTYVPAKYIVEPFGGRVTWSQTERKVTAELHGRTIEMWIGRNWVLVDGQRVNIDPGNAMPKVIGGRTMVPAKFLATVLDCQVYWVASSKTVVITNFQKPQQK